MMMMQTVNTSFGSTPYSV